MMTNPKKEQLTVQLPTELMTKFREAASKKFNYKRGYIKNATEEALIAWIKENQE